MGKRIMVVDDSTDIRTLTSLILRRAGYRVIEAENGRDALARLEREQVDLVVTDLNMPDIDGIGVAKGVRADKTHASIPIVMVTTVPGEAKEEEGRLAGVTAWVVKPYRPVHLLTIIAKVLNEAE